MRHSTGELTAKIERSGNLTIITFVADAVRDVENVIARELEGLTTETIARHLLLNFEYVDYLNSMELATLITLHKRAETAGGRLTLFSLSDDLFKVFTVTRLDTLLEICREGAGAARDRFPHQGVNNSRDDRQVKAKPH